MTYWYQMTDVDLVLDEVSLMPRERNGVLGERAERWEPFVVKRDASE